MGGAGGSEAWEEAGVKSMIPRAEVGIVLVQAERQTQVMELTDGRQHDSLGGEMLRCQSNAGSNDVVGAMRGYGGQCLGDEEVSDDKTDWIDATAASTAEVEGNRGEHVLDELESKAEEEEVWGAEADKREKDGCVDDDAVDLGSRTRRESRGGQMFLRGLMRAGKSIIGFGDRAVAGVGGGGGNEATSKDFARNQSLLMSIFNSDPLHKVVASI